MKRRRILYSGFIVITLVLGVALGTIVSERVTATQQPDVLTVPDPVTLSNGFANVVCNIISLGAPGNLEKSSLS